MFDLHSHILCGLDDGAESMEEAEKMFARAGMNGIHTICATSHYSRNVTAEKYNAAFDAAKVLAEKGRKATRKRVYLSDSDNNSLATGESVKARAGNNRKVLRKCAAVAANKIKLMSDVERILPLKVSVLAVSCPTAMLLL